MLGESVCVEVLHAALYERPAAFVTGGRKKFGVASSGLSEHHWAVRDDDFERLYAAHAEALLGFLVYRTGDRALAEDVVADTFERMLRTRFRFDPRKSSEKTWIYTIAMNLVRDHARRAGTETRALERVVEPVGGGRGPLEGIEDRDQLRRALDGLSAEEREAVALRFGGELTIPEIAKVTGSSHSTVHGRVYRALEKLRSELD
jgi:RNA polymerase sigma factor (sigma-70 family)